LVIGSPNETGEWEIVGRPYTSNAGKNDRKTKSGTPAYFAQEEGPQLMATAKALFPRWYAFILTGLLAGLRWGESAALYRGDIDWRRGRIHVQRTWSDKAGQIDAPKDSEGRYVKASPALLEALRAHLQVMADLRWVQMQLGHATIAQTAATYGHAQPDRHEAAVKGLGCLCARALFLIPEVEAAVMHRRFAAWLTPPASPAAASRCRR